MGLAGNRILDGTIGEHMALNISLFQKNPKPNIFYLKQLESAHRNPIMIICIVYL